MSWSSSLQARSSALSLVLVLAACGGGGGGGSATSPGTVTTPDPIVSAASVANFCAAPRSGTDPYTGRIYPDRAGSFDDEQRWLRAHMNERYLWPDEVPNTDRRQFSVAAQGSVLAAQKAYLQKLITPALLPSGKKKDPYSYADDTAALNRERYSGESVGYGVQFAFIQTTPPRKLMIAGVTPDSPGALAGLGRGAEVLKIDGADLVNGNDVDTLNDGLFPKSSTETHSFEVKLRDGSVRTVSLRPAVVKENAVAGWRILDAVGGKVAYINFSTFFLNSGEAELMKAFRDLQVAGVQDLVLDLRYNGGGYLDQAAELAYMIAGPNATAGKTFYRQILNPKNTRTAGNVPFHANSLGFDSTFPAGTALPYLQLRKLYVLTGKGSASASEAVINGLRGIDVEVVLVGATTNGKTTGMYALDNCGITYSVIEFRGVNAKGFGDFDDGFAPQCVVEDDFSKDLGDPAEKRLAAALHHRQHGNCPSAASGVAKPATELETLQLLRAPHRENLYAR